MYQCALVCACVSLCLPCLCVCLLCLCFFLWFPLCVCVRCIIKHTFLAIISLVAPAETEMNKGQTLPCIPTGEVYFTTLQIEYLCLQWLEMEK